MAARLAAVGSVRRKGVRKGPIEQSNPYCCANRQNGRCERRGRCFSESIGALAHLRALIPGQGGPQHLGQGLDLGRQRISDEFGGVAVGQMQQHRVVGGPLDQGADGRQVLAADDEISFRKTEALAREGRVWLRSPCVMSLTGNVRPTFLGRLGC